MSKSVNTTLPSNPVAPLVVIKAPSSLGACSNLTIDASGSTGSNGRQWLKVAWTVTASDGSDTSNIISALAANGVSVPATVPSTLLRSTTYYVQLQLTNFFGLSQVSGVTVMVKLTGGFVPSVSILGPSFLTVYPSADLTLTSLATVPNCLSGVAVSYSWSVQNDSSFSVRSFVGVSTKLPRVLSISPYSLSYGHSYVYTVTAAIPGSTVTGSASVRVYVSRDSVVASIAGGSNRVVSANTPLILDASSSVDKNVNPSLPSSLGFQWSCRLVTLSKYLQSCSSVFNGSTTGSIVRIPSESLTGNLTYQFTVIAQSADRALSSSQSVTISVVSACTTSIALTSSNLKYNANNPVSIYATIKGSVPILASWTLSGTPIGISTLTPTSVSISALDAVNSFQFPLAFASNTLTAGSSYTFRVTATNAQSGSKSSIYEEITISIRSPPSSGTLSASPSSGLALSTTFTVSAPGWTADPSDFPLSYTFYYSLYDSAANNPIGTSTVSPYVTTALASGSNPSNTVYLAVKVTGSTGTTSWAYGGVTVLPNTAITTSSLVTSLSTSLAASFKATDISEAVKSVSNAASTVNAVNCSSSPNCTALHRGFCFDTAHTCGSCKKGYIGIHGSSNYPCQRIGSIHRRLELLVVDGCTSDYDCPYGRCASGVCTEAVKSCPSTSV